MQIDDSDSLNNFTEDPAYFANLAASSPYYAFQSWMRASDTYSSWHAVSAAGYTDGKVVANVSLADGQTVFALPHASRIVVSAALERVEVPVHVELVCGAAPCADFEIDRNDRFILVQAPGDASAATSTSDAQSAYFPTQPLPYLAEALYLLVEVGIWSLVVFGFAVLLGAGLARLAPAALDAGTLALADASATLRRAGDTLAASLPRARAWVSRLPGDRWDALAAAVTVASLAWTLYVSRVLFAGQPHILDASAYMFQAKIFASGQLSAHAPTLGDAFKGPFMIADSGRWYSYFAPGTSAVLVPGLLLGIPWAVNPLLGALALWGTYRLGRLAYGGATGLLAITLGALSSFYTLLAATYMSHALALFLTVYGVLATVRFARRHRTRDLWLAAACVGGLLLTRELDALLLGIAVVAVLVVFTGREALRQESQQSADWGALLAPLVGAGVIVFVSAALYLGYNDLQTGDPLLLPRNVFLPSDHYGFGMGIGFYGQHTVAAGMVILDQLLTSLAIDLYGWPFYLTLAFVPLALLARRAGWGWDWLWLAGAAAITLSQAAYFYHGLYLGPRHLYEALPFLLLLTARGILALPVLAGRAADALLPRISRAALYSGARAATGCIVAALLLCNLLYFLPRQAQLANGFTGLPYYKPVDAAALYAFHPSNAIVITGDWMIYDYILFPLNDANLQGSTLYAYDATGAETGALAKQYPTRTLYLLQVDVLGHAAFTKITP